MTYRRYPRYSFERLSTIGLFIAIVVLIVAFSWWFIG